MKLKIAERSFDLSITKVMGTLVVNSGEDNNLEELVLKAHSMYASGAEFVEVGVFKKEDEILDSKKEISLLLPLIEELVKKTRLIVACNTSNPETMKAAVKSGASMIISPDSLKSEGALDVIAELKVPVVLCFPHNFDYGNEKDIDPIALVSEFIFERIDACLNAGISRKFILLDPTLGAKAPVELRVKLLGRLHSMQSFGLPVCSALPQSLPIYDEFLHDNKVITLTLGLFCSNKGAIQIVRTDDVASMALALGTWHLSNTKTKPFRLSKAIIRRFRNLRDKLKDRKSAKK